MNNLNNGKPVPSGYTFLDPRAAVWVESPYATIPGLAPDSTPHDIKRLTIQLQRNSTEAIRAALRDTRSLVVRLRWDLQSLGTTPGVAPEIWRETAELLHADQRASAYALWIARLKDADQRLAALHVCAVLSAADLAWNAKHAPQDLSSTCRHYIAFWSALLAQPNWLRRFALERAKAWARPEPPSDDDHAEWLAAASASAEEQLRRALESLESQPQQQTAIWDDWHREQAAIAALTAAGGGQRHRPPWTPGLGPLGLELLGEADAAQRWLLAECKAYRGGLPLASLKAGEVALDTPGERAGEAVAALQCLHSSLGAAAAYLWRGQGHLAWNCLQAEQDAALDEAFEDPWFGQGKGGLRRRTRALDEMKIEALLSRLQIELSHIEERQYDPVETARHLLFLAESFRRPKLIVDGVERQIIGRLTACAEARELPPAAALARLINVALEMREQLVARGAGKFCALPISNLLCRRAAKNWSRYNDERRPERVQHEVFKDMMLAVQLAPQNEDMLLSLCVVALKFRMGSKAEQTNRQELVLSLVQDYLRSSDPTTTLDSVYLQLLIMVDPVAAKKEFDTRLPPTGNPKP